jgi:hypothetical protein
MLSLKSLVNSIFLHGKIWENIYEQQFVRPYYAYYWENTVSLLSSEDIRKMGVLSI